jgi:hypothetical protein
MGRLSKILEILTLIDAILLLIVMIVLTVVPIIRLITQPSSKEAILCLILSPLVWPEVLLWVKDIIRWEEIPRLKWRKRRAKP